MAYWQTVWLVIRSVGRLGGHMGGPVNYRDAQTFRWLTVAHATLLPVGWLTIRIVATTSGIGGSPLDQFRDRQMWVLLGVLAAIWAAALLGLSGVVSWFFCPRGWDTERQNRAVALSYYLCAPLAPAAAAGAGILAVLPWADRPAVLQATLLAAGAVQGVLYLYWFVLVLVASRDVARRSAGGVIATALTLPVLWFVVKVAITYVVPVGVLMLLLLRASLD